MVGREKKAKMSRKGSQEDLISKLPDHLICDILYHLPTKHAVRTSVLSTRWRSLWQCVPGLNLDSCEFSNPEAFVSFADRFFDSHKDQEIRKLRLSTYARSYRSSWIDAVTTRRIQHLDLLFLNNCQHSYDIPQSMYSCKTLVQLRLNGLALSVSSAEFVSLPCLKVMRLVFICYSNSAALEKLISGSPVLEDLTLNKCSRPDDNSEVLQVRSQTLKRIDIDDCTQAVIDSPLLQCLRTRFNSRKKNYKIIGSGFPAKLDIDVTDLYTGELSSKGSVISDILTDISKVKDLVIRKAMWEVISLYSKSRPLCQFHYISRLNSRLYKSDLELLPTLLESCPELESLILELVEEPYIPQKKKRQPKVTFSTVPRCLVSSLKFVEWKRSSSISGYEGEMEILRYILKNSTILEKLRVDVYYPEKAKCAWRRQLLALPKCSSACEVIVL